MIPVNVTGEVGGSMSDITVSLRSSQPLEVKTFGVTDRGRVRRSNEDQFLIAELTKTMRIWQTSLPDAKAQFSDERGHLFLVADGMGGHQGGEQASALAVAAIQQFTLNTLKWFFESNQAEAQRVLAQFQSALREADRQVRQEAAAHEELSGMGTTVTMAYHLESQLCVVHVGDSRAYLLRDAALHQITRDHTLMAELVSSGALQPEEVATHRFRHVITNVVGGNEAGVKVEAHAIQVQPGDYLLLCTDGLTEMVANDAIATTMRDAADPEAACKRLLAMALEAGGRDNVTVMIVRFDAMADAAAAPGAAA
jgi:PPM family protein phosphatase